jgi:hypothetical protein
MNKLKTATYIAVLIASIMTIFYIGNANQRQYTYECDKIFETAQRIIRDDFTFVNDEELERGEAYATYYNAFCKP